MKVRRKVATGSRDVRKPFLKWAGGKRQLLSQLLPHLPKDYSRYFEPFVGGGALFFALQPRKATIADSNKRLIRTYRAVKNDVGAVIGRLRRYAQNHNEGFFYSIRNVDIDSCTDEEVAAWFIYLNKTGYNGLYRVNRENRFNVPFGRYANPTICDEETLRSCSSALAGATILHRDFEAVVSRAKPSDFVYFDPPYAPLSATSSFTSYTSEGFGRREQERLRDVALTLKTRGVHVLLSNSSDRGVRHLYEARGFELVEVSATRMVNCRSTARGRVGELVFK
jgi:DNA adenine methylase